MDKPVFKNDNDNDNELIIINEEVLHEVFNTKHVPSSESDDSRYDEWLDSEDEMKLMILSYKEIKSKKKEY